MDRDRIREIVERVKADEDVVNRARWKGWQPAPALSDWVPTGEGLVAILDALLAPREGDGGDHCSNPLCAECNAAEARRTVQPQPAIMHLIVGADHGKVTTAVTTACDIEVEAERGTDMRDLGCTANARLVTGCEKCVAVAQGPQPAAPSMADALLPRDEAEREACRGVAISDHRCPATMIDSGVTYSCDRLRGHVGDHVAAAGEGVVVARWPQPAAPESATTKPECPKSPWPNNKHCFTVNRPDRCAYCDAPQSAPAPDSAEVARLRAEVERLTGELRAANVRESETAARSVRFREDRDEARRQRDRHQEQELAAAKERDYFGSASAGKSAALLRIDKAIGHISPQTIAMGYSPEQADEVATATIAKLDEARREAGEAAKRLAFAEHVLNCKECHVAECKGFVAGRCTEGLRLVAAVLEVASVPALDGKKGE